MKSLICIVCPKGCHLSVDEEKDWEVSGHGCQRGVTYGKKELTNPTRVLTSTVKIKGADYKRCPVKTNGDIPKGLITDAMALLNGVEIHAPVHCGDVVISNICGTGIDFVVTREM